MPDKSKEILNRIISHEDRIRDTGESFLVFSGKVYRMATYVKRVLDESQLRREAEGSMPLVVAKEHEKELSEMESLVSQIGDLLEKNFKPTPQYEETKIESGTAISSIAASILFGIADEERGSFGVGNSESASSRWGDIHANAYITYQGKKADSIMDKIKKFDPQIAEDFDGAVKMYNKWECHLSDHVSLGKHLRNTLEHFKGSLWEKAKQHPREQKFKWEEIAKRLSKGGEGSIECNLFIKLEKEEKELWNMVVNLEKGIVNQLKHMGLDLSEVSVKIIYTKWLGFFDTVLPLIDLKYFSYLASK